MDKISEYLTLDDCKKSATAKRLGIDNTPNEAQIESLKKLGVEVYDKVKKQFPNCYTESVFRSVALNTAIKGALSSQHCLGEAIDIDSPTTAYNLEIFKWVLKNISFDQMIAEFPDDHGPAWVHVSWKSKEKNRKQVLTAAGEHTGAGASYVTFTGKESWFK